MVDRPNNPNMMSLAKYVYDEQRDEDTAPADMGDVTAVILMMARKIIRLENQIKALKKQLEQ